MLPIATSMPRFTKQTNSDLPYWFL